MDDHLSMTQILAEGLS